MTLAQLSALIDGENALYDTSGAAPSQPEYGTPADLRALAGLA